MKTKLRNILPVYKAFGEAMVTTIEDSEVIKIINARKSMRPHIKEFEDFIEDAKEKMKPAGFDEKMKKVKDWNRLSDDEKNEINDIENEYKKKIDKVCVPELDKEVDVKYEPLSDESVMKILKENKWPVNKLDILELMCEK